MRAGVTVVMKMWGIFMLSLELGQKGPGETGLLGLLAPKSLQAMLYKYIYGTFLIILEVSGGVGEEKAGSALLMPGYIMGLHFGFL